MGAIWLSPFYPSPMKDFGYDVADYCGVDPVFGTLDDADRLIAAVHERGMRIIIDWVPGHTSDEHPWFVDARSSRTSKHRDWYVWRDGSGDGPPNNWRAAFKGVPAWTRDPASGQYFLHSFLPGQPDLNWENPDVREAMHGVLRFWLDRGVDGFRADVVHNIGKDPLLLDLDSEQAGVPRFLFNDEAHTHEYLREIRSLLDSYDGDRMMVGEVVLFSTEQMAAYYGRGDELNLVFNFKSLYAPWRARAWAECIRESEAALSPQYAWPAWVLSNHDLPRHRTRYGGEAQARAAALMLLTLRGTPFVYMGEELGLPEADVPDEARVDPGGRDGCRVCIPWDASLGAGWSEEPWLPLAPEAGLRNVEAQAQDPASMLNLYRRLIRIRANSSALREGSIEVLRHCGKLLVYRRCMQDDSLIVAVNFSAAEVLWEDAPALAVEVASDARGEGEAFGGSLRPYQALLMSPRLA